MEKEIEFIKSNYDTILNIVTVIFVLVLVLVSKKNSPLLLAILLGFILTYHILMYPNRDQNLLLYLGILIIFRYIIMNEWSKGFFTIDLWNLPYWGLEFIFLQKYNNIMSY